MKDPAIPHLDIDLNKPKMLNQKDTHIHLFIAMLFAKPKVWKPPKSVSINR